MSENKYTQCISNLLQMCLKIQISTGKRKNIDEKCPVQLENKMFQNGNIECWIQVIQCEEIECLACAVMS